jgi:uncharacterized membrane protein
LALGFAAPAIHRPVEVILARSGTAFEAATIYWKSRARNSRNAVNKSMIFSRAIRVSVAAIGLSSCVSGPAPDAPALTAENLRAATYRGILDDPVTLADGRYEGAPFVAGAASRPVVRLVPGMTATGDLTGDGVDEAAVVLAHNAGGSGVFMHLAIVQATRSGPDNSATVKLGDRVKVIAVRIVGGRIAVQLVEHAPDDPMCCPTRQAERAWRLEGHELIEIEQAGQPRAGRARGHLVWGHETRSFTECDTGREAWVFNESGDELAAIYQELTSEPYQPMFVEVRGSWVAAPDEGFAADYPEAFRITELLRAENEGFGCRLDLGNVLFVANGNEPSWRLQIRADGLSLRTMDAPDEIVFAAPEPSEYAGLVTYYSRNSRDQEMRVTLERRRCVDSMSGARYAWAATVDLDGRRLTGCAAEGI